MMEKFDFKESDLSKEPNQEKFNEEFEKLEKEKKNKVVDEAWNEALKVNKKFGKKEGEKIKTVERNDEKLEIETVEKELSPEQIEKIMEKVQDINKYNTFYLNFYGRANGHLNLVFPEKDNLHLGEGSYWFNIVGRNANMSGNKLTPTDYFYVGGIHEMENIFGLIFNNKGLKEQFPNQARKNKERNTYFINTHSRFDLGSFDDLQPGSLEVKEKIQKLQIKYEKIIHDTIISMINEGKIPESYRNKTWYWSGGEGGINNYIKNGLLSVPQEEIDLINEKYITSREDDIINEMLKNKEFNWSEFYDCTLFNKKGDTSNEDYQGFQGYGGIDKEQYRGFIVDSGFDIYKKTIDINNEKKSFINLIMSLGYKNLVPVYDYEGNLRWPKQMKYEEVKKFVAERDKNKQES